MFLLIIIITYTQISCGLMGKSRIFGVLQCVFESRQDKGVINFWYLLMSVRITPR